MSLFPADGLIGVMSLRAGKRPRNNVTGMREVYRGEQGSLEPVHAQFTPLVRPMPRVPWC